jgi:hypothetical protein
MLDLRGVWECDRDCFSNCFLFRNASKLYIFFKFIYDISISKHKNIYKKLILNNVFWILANLCFYSKTSFLKYNFSLTLEFGNGWKR